MQILFEMTGLLALIGIGISAFVATKIDDLFVLMFFFSDKKFGKIQVTLGQYLGISLLILVSTLGALVSLVIPQSLIGLLGLVPITIGIIRLVRPEKEENSLFESRNGKISKWAHLSSLTVTAVTFSNGGDNIGIYTPLFAKYNAANEIILISSTFLVMTAIWCIFANYLAHHSIIANRIRKYEHIIFPFVLIGLGIYILVDSFLF